jgi:lipopolysaccharide transport system ATP-binding protein
MKEKNVIEVKNIFKYYNLNYKEKSTVFEAVTNSLKQKPPMKLFPALTNVTFDVKKGEMLGIIGHNGSGKSTLLKILSDIIKPTKGKIKREGKIVPFLNLGAGFHPDLTALENVKIYASMLGMNKEQIEERTPVIFEYSELEDFKFVKLKNFSSGMFARLAFATAIQSEPDILLIDEVLAVGDLKFQKKCQKTFEDFKKNRKTIVYVTHNLEEIKQYCDRAILMFHGHVGDIGEPSKIVDKYQTIVEKSPLIHHEEIGKKISKYYDEILERNVDVNGILEYIYKIKKGEIRLEDVPQILKNSDEYRQKQKM